MTLNEIKELLAESEKTGRPIQYQNTAGTWSSMNPDGQVSLEAPRERYRVKPANPREWWIHSMGRPVKAGESNFIDDTHKQDGWVRVREILETIGRMIYQGGMTELLTRLGLPDIGDQIKGDVERQAGMANSPKRAK